MSRLDTDLLQNWLPEILHDTPAVGVLKILTEMYRHIHEQIDSLPDTLAPLSSYYELPVDEQQTQKKRDYLKWFSSWVNLVVSEDWEDQQKRDILAKILPLYKKRGTVEGLTEYLKIYAGEGIAIQDDLPPIQVGDKASSQVGVNMVIGGFPPDTPAMQLPTEQSPGVSQLGDNTIIEGFPPYFFIVRAAVSVSGPMALQKKRKAIIKILEMEKPAHTWYRLWVRGPTFIINDPNTAILGVNTII